MNETKSSRGTVLETPLSRALRSAVDEAAVRRIWSGIEQRLPGQRATRPARGAWLALAALVFSAVVYLLASRLGHDAAPRALLLEDGRAFDSVEGGDVEGRDVEGHTVRFSDGSRIEAAAGARVEALASTPSELSLLVRRGKARFFVTPGGPRRWSIDARGVRVEVVGTVLSVEASERVVHVAVEVGVVLVRSPLLPDGVQRVSAGQELSLALPAPQVSSVPREARVEAAADASAVRTPETQPPRPRKPLPQTHEPVPAPSPAIESASELWRRADDARASAEPELAITLLEQLVQEQPGDEQAPLAAFTLGTLLAEQGRPERAARAFRRALELGLPSALSDTCLRRIEELERRAAPH
jgi:transmembrane sensor